MAPLLIFKTCEQKKAGNEARLRLPLVGQALIQFNKVSMKVLAQANSILSMQFPLAKRRTLKYSLVRPRTSVPSTLEFMRVNNATVREGRAHRVWPPDVLRKFQTAEIITELQTQHYVLRDSSITRVSQI